MIRCSSIFRGGFLALSMTRSLALSGDFFWIGFGVRKNVRLELVLSVCLSFAAMRTDRLNRLDMVDITSAIGQAKILGFARFF
jgi:hypothetical protein